MKQLRGVEQRQNRRLYRHRVSVAKVGTDSRIIESHTSISSGAILKGLVAIVLQGWGHSVKQQNKQQQHSKNTSFLPSNGKRHVEIVRNRRGRENKAVSKSTKQKQRNESSNKKSKMNQ
jgi:hypothetical protein